MVALSPIAFIPEPNHDFDEAKRGVLGSVHSVKSIYFGISCLCTISQRLRMEAKSFARRGLHCNQMPLNFPYYEWHMPVFRWRERCDWMEAALSF